MVSVAVAIFKFPFICYICPHFHVMSLFPCYVPISMLCPYFHVMSPFPCYVPISMLCPHFHVMSQFPCYVPISMLCPNFHVISPYLCYVPIYLHIYVMSPFISISMFNFVSISMFNFVSFSDLERLPTASTCSRRLNLPEYSSKSELKEKLMKSVAMGGHFYLY